MPAKKHSGGGTKDHGASIKRPAVYEALRREGMDKGKAAAISNSMGGKRGAKGGKKK